MDRWKTIPNGSDNKWTHGKTDYLRLKDAFYCARTKVACLAFKVESFYSIENNLFFNKLLLQKPHFP